MVLKTRRFGEIEIEVYEKDGLQIISHTALMKLFYEKKAERKFQTKYETIFINEKGMTVRCFIKDGDEIIEGFGESNELSLDGEIGKQFPHTIANNRAMDNAFLNYLGLEKKAYSDSEIDKTGATKVISETPVKSSKTKKAENKTEKNVSENSSFEEAKDTPFETPIENSINPPVEEVPVEADEEVPVEIDRNEETPEETNETPVEVSVETDDEDVNTEANVPVSNGDDGSDFIIASGRMAGKHFSEADEKWINWMMKQVQDYPMLMQNGACDKKDLFENFIKYANANGLWEKYNATPVSIVA